MSIIINNPKNFGKKKLTVRKEDLLYPENLKIFTK